LFSLHGPKFILKLGESDALAEKLQEDAKKYALEKQRMEV
jgi:hypothetical protein